MANFFSVGMPLSLKCMHFLQRIMRHRLGKFPTSSWIGCAQGREDVPPSEQATRMTIWGGGQTDRTTPSRTAGLHGLPSPHCGVRKSEQGNGAMFGADEPAAGLEHTGSMEYTGSPPPLNEERKMDVESETRVRPNQVGRPSIFLFCLKRNATITMTSLRSASG